MGHMTPVAPHLIPIYVLDELSKKHNLHLINFVGISKSEGIKRTVYYICIVVCTRPPRPINAQGGPGYIQMPEYCQAYTYVLYSRVSLCSI